MNSLETDQAIGRSKYESMRNGERKNNIPRADGRSQFVLTVTTLPKSSAKFISKTESRNVKITAKYKLGKNLLVRFKINLKLFETLKSKSRNCLL